MVIEELKKLDVTKAPGPDNIKKKILKDDRFELYDILANLIKIILIGQNTIKSTLFQAKNRKQHMPYFLILQKHSTS